MSTENLIFAIPSKGRFMEESCSLLREAGLEFGMDNRQLTIPATFQDDELLLALMRPRDIAKFVATEQIQLGIVGADTLKEYGYLDNINRTREVQRLLNLGIGRCSLVLAAPEDSGYRTCEEVGDEWKFLQQFAGRRIATSYRGIVENYFDSWESLVNKDTWADLSVPRTYTSLDGAVEVAPRLGLADVVADLTETGKTMEANGLRVLKTIYESEGILITTTSNEKGDIPLLDRIRDRLFEIMLARGNQDALNRKQRYEELLARVEAFR